MTESDKTDGTTLVLRRDRVGRVRRSAEQRAEILAQFDRSGLSGPQFARVAGISYQTLATWLKKRRESDVGPMEPADGAPVFFMQAVVGSSGGGDAGLELKFGGGASATITTPQQARLAAVLVGELSAGRRSGC
jgi:hypothetical protein